ncbi:adenylate/guanylate cyclase domain-containing protein [Mycobacterium sp. 1081908.1]|uniref:ATP-binding protein n=1 Tax=Mycobacterium sp. 1081908.1 TaxID=1834066 RepID=UPI0007FDEBA4|nr:adenylate/guanylate cyclase domain-containing protein [Mycobacterium sp. 1081908.1]OBK52411.1 cyclase [Mycobacterium sp. 1081908.1]
MTTASACRTCGTEPLANARFCHGCGSPVAATEAKAEYKQVTVLFADVVGSMDIATAVGAERLREIMAALVDRCTAVVRRYGGTVDKFTGDGIMAVFGAPIALENHAFRACLAGLAIQEAVEGLAVEIGRRDGVDLRLRVGLNSGQVIAGEIGSRALGYTAIGEQVGMAQRMESAAPPGGVMLSMSTARLVEDAVVVGAPELVRIKGADEPVAARRLVGILEGPRSGRNHPALVGRASELNTIGEVFDEAFGGAGRVIGVRGSPGMGKSRIVEESAALAGHLGAEVFFTYCESHTSDVPFHAVTGLLRARLGLNNIDSAAARVRIRDCIPDGDPEDLTLLDDLLGIRDTRTPSPDIDPDARRRRLTALIQSAWLAQTVAALYVIEDAHWIDHVSDSMFGEFLSVVRQTPSAVLITYRPEYIGPLIDTPGAQSISLAPLTVAETGTLLGQLLGSHPSVAAVKELVSERAGGNPFFAQEMVRDLAERGVLDGDRGSYRSATDIAEVTVPATLHATLAARIDRLGARAKQTLNAAAVIGSRLDADLLSSVVDGPLVAPLIEADLMEQVAATPRIEYAFRHPLIRAVAYESQLKSDRAALHRRLAAAIGEHDPGSADENAALIAEHLDAAGESLGAYAQHMRAGAWLMTRDIVAARRSWERARQVADALPAELPDRTSLRIHPRTMLCYSTWRVGGSAEETGFEDLRELCTASGNRVWLVASLSGAVLSLTMSNRHHESVRLASEQIAVFASAVDPMDHFAVMSGAMFAKLHGGEAAESLRVAQKVIELVGDDGSKGNVSGLGSPLAVALLYSAHARAALGDRHWRDDFQRAIAIQQGLRGPSGLVIVITYGYTLAVTNGLLLPDAAALSDTADVLGDAERCGEDVAVALAQVAHGLLLTHSDVQGGLELVSAGRDALLRLRNLLGVSMADIRIAQLKAEAGDVDGAIALARATVTELTDSGEMLVRGAASAALVSALLSRGHDTDVDEAQATIDRLAATPVEPGFVANELPLLRMRALVARARGDDAAYRDFVARYRDAATKLGFDGHIAMAEAMP